MAIESVTSKIQGQQILEQGVDLKLADAQLAKSAAPILGGESVKVTDGAMTDLEKLVARLKNESEATRQSVAERRIAILSTVLDSMADKITAAEKENLLKIEELNGEKAGLQDELAALNDDKDVVQALIDSLDRQIEQAVKDGADHREQVEKLKAQRAEQQAKLDAITESIQSVSAKVAGIDVKIAECTKAIASSTLNEVANALRIAEDESFSLDSTNDVAKESDAKRRKAEAKAEATDIGNVIKDALDKIDAQILQALAEAQELVKA